MAKKNQIDATMVSEVSNLTTEEVLSMTDDPQEFVLPDIRKIVQGTPKSKRGVSGSGDSAEYRRLIIGLVLVHIEKENVPCTIKLGADIVTPVRNYITATALKSVGKLIEDFDSFEAAESYLVSEECPYRGVNRNVNPIGNQWYRRLTNFAKPFMEKRPNWVLEKVGTNWYCHFKPVIETVEAPKA